MTGTGADSYLLGHSADELDRLTHQAAFLGDLTEDVLRRAGLQPGMRVLDVGCGAGDVALIAGRMVGPDGAVLGIDRTAEPLSLARQRAAQAGMGWVRFEQQDATALPPGPLFDAVVGRLLLINVPDPGGLLRTLVRQVRPGGVVAFQEMDITRCNAVPQTPVMQQLLVWGVTLFERAGLLPDAGTRLAALFRGAGITPSLIGACRMESVGEGFGYTWIAQTFRSLAPMLHRLEIATPEALDIDTLETRLRQEAQEHGACLVCPLMVGAWGRVPDAAADQSPAGRA